MSYMLHFPPSELPLNVFNPPYVDFFIQSKDVHMYFASKIPLNMMIHFAPKLADWIIAIPKNLPTHIVNDLLRSPRVGLNIPLDVPIAGLQWIVNRMLQCSGIPVGFKPFDIRPSVVTSVKVLCAWKLLDLPPKGVDQVYTHLLTHLWFVPINLHELHALWRGSPHYDSSELIKEIAKNIVRASINFDFSAKQFHEIRDYVSSHPELNTLLHDVRDEMARQFPAASAVSFAKEKGNKSQSAGASGEVSDCMAPVYYDDVDLKGSIQPRRSHEILLFNRTNRMTTEEKREKEKRDGAAMRRRLSRTQSSPALRDVFGEN